MKNILDENNKPLIFISHSTVDSEVADILRDYLVGVGVPNDCIFCSSLPGNDVKTTIPLEVKNKLKNSTINIAILSKDYYESAYCLNEAGILWFQDDKPCIVIAMPEITQDNMFGFLNNDNKLRRLDNEHDLASIFDIVFDKITIKNKSASVILTYTKKTCKKFNEHIKNRMLKVNENPNKCKNSEDNDISNKEYLEKTDDEIIILYYLINNKVRKIKKEDLKLWLNENEIYNVNIDNGFDLLSTYGNGKYYENVLELDAKEFRKFISKSEKNLKIMYETVEKHMKFGSATLFNLFKSDKLDDDIILFISYIIDEKINKFGDRWMADLEIKNIEDWELCNDINGELSNNYGKCLAYFIDKDLVYESDWTSYGNPREYTLCKSLKEVLFNNPDVYLKKIDAVKQKYAFELPF